ncbi:MAG: FAD-dependent oxidoreductase [Ginsengibacter sp.]
MPLKALFDLNESIISALDDKQQAFMQMGFGNVIKINIKFKVKIWETNKGHAMPNAGFIFSDALIPTWWTQNPVDDCTLNGWLAGPQSQRLNNLSLEQQKVNKIESIAYIFNAEQSFIIQKIKDYIITNWADDSYAGGAYSYENTGIIIYFSPVKHVTEAHIRALLRQPFLRVVKLPKKYFITFKKIKVISEFYSMHI